MAYVVSNMDICVQGFERLRSQSEFLLVVPVGPDDADDMDGIIQSLKDDIQSCDRGDTGDEEPFDYPEAERVAEQFIKRNWPHIAKQLRGLDPLPIDADCEEGCSLYLYIDTDGD